MINVYIQWQWVDDHNLWVYVFVYFSGVGMHSSPFLWLHSLHIDRKPYYYKHIELSLELLMWMWFARCLNRSGHYVAWVRRKGDDWLMYDDENVTPITSADVLKLSGGGNLLSYILNQWFLLWFHLSSYSFIHNLFSKTDPVIFQTYRAFFIKILFSAFLA